jgi:exosortase K
VKLTPAISGATLREHRWRIVGVLVVLAVVVAGKQFYRDASAADLRWILAPTAQLVSWTSGGTFVYEAGPGWVDPQLRFIIAPPCAGVNFALAAFLALALGGVMGMTSMRSTLARLGLAATLAYLATLVINTIRITIAIEMHRGSLDLGGLDRAEAHQVEGIIVYLAGLIGLYALARAITQRGMRALWWVAVPIAAYLVITLVLPAANGAASRPDFARHAALVLGACLTAIAITVAITAFTRVLRRKS